MATAQSVSSRRGSLSLFPLPAKLCFLHRDRPSSRRVRKRSKRDCIRWNVTSVQSRVPPAERARSSAFSKSSSAQPLAGRCSTSRPTGLRRVHERSLALWARLSLLELLYDRQRRPKQALRQVHPVALVWTQLLRFCSTTPYLSPSRTRISRAGARLDTRCTQSLLPPLLVATSLFIFFRLRLPGLCRAQPRLSSEASSRSCETSSTRSSQPLLLAVPFARGSCATRSGRSARSCGRSLDSSRSHCISRRRKLDKERVTKGILFQALQASRAREVHVGRRPWSSAHALPPPPTMTAS